MSCLKLRFDPGGIMKELLERAAKRPDGLTWPYVGIEPNPKHGIALTCYDAAKECPKWDEI
jgi:hypothetical protein